MRDRDEQHVDTPRTSREYDNERNMGEFWSNAAPRKEPFKQAWYVPALILLIILSIPWYLSEGHIGTVVAGLPVWVWTTLICSVGVSALTALAVLRFWKDDGSSGSE